MPLKKRGRRRLATVAGVAALALAALPSAAFAANCWDRPQVYPAFQSIDGDLGLYFGVPGGTFESRWAVQTTGDASFVAAGHGNWLAGPTAVQLDPEASVTTGAVCIDVNRPHTRFGMKSLSGTGSLVVQAVTGDRNAVTLATIDAADAGTSWQATQPIGLPDALGLVDGTSRQVSLRLTATGGSWLADGVAVDPYRR
jgi:hypothetical protein